MAIGPEVSDALDAMPARDVERLIDKAQRRLARCFACGTDGAFPATITSKLRPDRQHPCLDPHLRRLLGPGHAARGEGDRWVGRPRPTTGANGGRRIRRTGSGSASVLERDAGPATARRRRRRARVDARAHRVAAAPSAPDVGAGARRRHRPRGPPGPPHRRALSPTSSARSSSPGSSARTRSPERRPGCGAERSWRHHLAPLLEVG